MRTLFTFFFAAIICFSCNRKVEKIPGKVTPSHGLTIENGIHTDTGLKDDPNLPLVIANCTACHSAQLIIQNRATREGWKSMITWMQETQKLWDLGPNEELVLDYLEKNYSPDSVQSRRAKLENIEWYELD